MNINNLVTFYDINMGCPPGRIVVSHDSDVSTRTIEVFFRQGVIPLAISQDCTAKAAFVERQTNILINDNVPCTVTENGTVLIPVDNLHRQGRFDMNIELTVTNQDGEKVLVTPFPMWITVNGSILNDAEVTEESKGTVPDLLEAAEEALAHNKDYDALDNRPQINGHVLTGDQTAEDLGIETGGSDDYNDLNNKPTINGITLSGNKYDSDLGLQGRLTPENGLYILSGNRIGLNNYYGYLKWLTNGDLDNPGIYALNSLGYFDAQTWGASLPENADCYVASLAPNPTSYMVQVAFAIASKKTYIRTSTNQEIQKTWGTWEELSGGGSAIASGVINSNGTITFYDENGVALFTTTGASVIGAQGNSVTNAEIINSNLIIHIGVLQPDGTILDTPINVGRVVGQNGAQGQHGDGYTAAQIDANGDLIVTEVVYSGGNYSTRQVNLGHVVGADGAPGAPGAPGTPGTSVTDATINNQGHLILTLSDGTTIDAGYVGTPKLDIAGAVITLSQNTYTYDGTSKAPSVTSVTLNGQALTAGTDYAVVANPATNSGQYVVTVSGIGDYTGTETVNWVINKAQATISGDDSITISGLDEPVSKTYTTNGDGTFSFAISGNVATVTNTGGVVTITPTAYGSADLTVTVSEGQNYLGATKSVPITVEELQTATVFGVVWGYSLSSPQLARLTPQTDPLGVVTTVPSQEPTACVGNDGNGQSEFDDFMPWKGMQRFNYVNGQVVDFVSYNNGETFIFIPEFWSKIVDDSVNSKMYFYISDSELEGFTKHYGSERYVSRYELDENYHSSPGTVPKSGVQVSGFRYNIMSIDKRHFMFDFSTYNALILLYIIEFANLNSQSKIGDGITSAQTVHTIGETDVLTYHTGRVSGDDNDSAIHYRYIENPWGNIWSIADGVFANGRNVFICTNIAHILDRSSYTNTNISTPSTNWAYITKFEAYDNCYLIPKVATGGSNSTFTCDFYGYRDASNMALRLGGKSNDRGGAGLFYWLCDIADSDASPDIGSRSILVLGGD